MYSRTVLNDAHLLLTPGDVMTLLGVSSSTLSRLTQDYETVYGSLDRTSKGGRTWTAEAADTVRKAQAAVKAGEATSHREALEALRDGRDLPTRTPASNLSSSAPSEALDALALQVAQQGQGLAELLQGLDARDAGLTKALQALAQAQEAQMMAIQTLAQQVQVSTNAHVPAPPGKRRRHGLLTRLLLAVLDRE